MIESSITDELSQLLNNEKFIDDGDNSEQYKKYSEALELYKKMVKDGLVKPRGNRLIGIEDRVRINIKYNTPF